MHTTCFFPAKSRLVPARMLCAGAVCLALLFPQVGFAGEKAAENSGTPAFSRQTPAYAGTAEPIAGQIAARAEFAAKLAPKLGTVAALYTNAARIPGRAVDVITDCLWLLRAEPELERARLETLLAAKTEKEAKKAYRELLAFVENVKRLALKLDNSAERQQFAKRRKELREARKEFGRKEPGRTEYSAQAISLHLDENKALAAALVPAVSVAAILDAATLHALVADDAAIDSLRGLKDKPDDLHLAANVLGNANLAEPQKRALLAELASSPKTAKQKIASLEKAGKVQKAYTFAMRTELRGDIVGLPLAAVVPDIPLALERADATPLAASPAKEPQRALTFAGLERLAPVEEAKEKNKTPSLPILRPGERLYTLSLDSGRPVFMDGPLAALAYAGPHLAEFTRETAADFLALFNADASAAWNRSYFIAATCGPEELAAHLGSLAVVRSERERSLYGPFADYLWRPGKDDAPAYAYPKDVMGETLRLTNICDADLFFSLAPLADEKGLARLMGPIRGIWAKDSADGKPWAEMRYAPRKNSLGKGWKLDHGPELSLDKDALLSIVRGKERLLVREWAVFSLGAACRNGGSLNKSCAEALPAALEKTQKTFDSLNLLGVASPWDKGAMVYYLTRYAKEPALLERLTAVINDTRRSPAQRILALEQATDKK